MKKTGIVAGAVLAALVLIGVGYSHQQQQRGAEVAQVAAGYFQAARNDGAPQSQAGALSTSAVSAVFVEDSTGVDDGVQRLARAMQTHGAGFHQTAAEPSGLIAANAIVLLKINAQWDQRGGTNTDLIRGVIQEVLNHPDGFSGEIIVADNGQGIGRLDWVQNNAENRGQSAMSVIRAFQAQGHRVTGVLWDNFTNIRVQEFSEGDMADGFVVESAIRPTGLEISYPKFTTEFGTQVSFRHGVWNEATRTYNSDMLKVINMPVLKAHYMTQVTAAVKNFMGVPSNALTGRRPHNSVLTGGMGTLMAQTRMPVLNIIDMIWIAPDRGPWVSYDAAVRANKIAASTDPFALDYWTTRHVLMPEAARFPGRRAVAMDPAGAEPGTFGHWMRLSMDEVRTAGIAVTMNPAEMLIVQNGIARQ